MRQKYSSFFLIDVRYSRVVIRKSCLSVILPLFYKWARVNKTEGCPREREREHSNSCDKDEAPVCKRVFGNLN